MTFVKLSFIISPITKLLEVLWQHSEGQLLIVFNVVRNLKLHQIEPKVQNIAVQNANINIGWILNMHLMRKAERLNGIVKFVGKSLKLLFHKIMNFVQNVAPGMLKRNQKFVSVHIAENLLKLKNPLKTFVVLGNAVVHEIEHLIGRRGKKNLRNVNVVEKNFGQENIQGKEDGANSVLRSVSQNLSKYLMLLHQNSTIWLNGKKFAKKFLNVTAINVKLAGSMGRDFMFITLNISEMEAMRT